MTDYISREALLKLIGTMPSSPITDREERIIRAFISTVKTFPAADVRPVKRAHWKEDWEMGCSKCSECGEGFLWEDFNGVAEWNFCPNCGADMRQKEENDGT